MKTWQKVLAGVAVLILGFIGFVASRPTHFTLSRSQEISAPAAKIFPLVADFHGWQAWSPWDKMDPGMKRTYAGTAMTVGQVYEWQGNDKVGKGRMTVVELQEAKLVRIKLEFIEPFPTTNDTRFTFTANGDKTTVSWIMEGENDTLFRKAFGLMMESMVGPDFESGLAAMKAAAEAK